MIDKKINYCWFGNQEKDEKTKKCIKSWEKMEGYQIIEWNEKNCNLEENEYIIQAAKNKKWAFVSDYFRLKILYEHGGIYLDTDVEIKKEFSKEILENQLFLSFECDCYLSTAIIGCEKKNKIIKQLLDKYNEISFNPTNNNNKLYNDFIIEKYKEFKLNNTEQILGDNELHVYPKEYFTCPTNKKEAGYSIHHFAGSWIKKSKFKKTLINIVKCIIGENNYLKLARKRSLKKSSYYSRYLEDKKK